MSRGPAVMPQHSAQRAEVAAKALCKLCCWNSACTTAACSSGIQCQDLQLGTYCSNIFIKPECAYPHNVVLAISAKQEARGVLLVTDHSSSGFSCPAVNAAIRGCRCLCHCYCFSPRSAHAAAG